MASGLTVPATAWTSPTRRRSNRSPRSAPRRRVKLTKRLRQARPRLNPDGATCRQASAPNYCTTWPDAFATTSSPSPNSRRATLASQSATPAGRPMPGQRCSSITPGPSVICAARQSRWRGADSISRCASQWASSPPSRHGISRSSSPAGRSPQRSPLVTRLCSSQRRSRR